MLRLLKKIHSYSRHIFRIKSILACFLAFSEKVTENFASQFARTEAVLLIVVNDVCDAVLSLHRSLLVLPVGVRSSNVEKSFLFIAQRNSRFQLYCFTLGFAGGFPNKTNLLYISQNFSVCIRGCSFLKETILKRRTLFLKQFH